jgi:hypothetical protein
MMPRALLPALALAALLGGCVKPSATVEIYGACVPPTPTTTSGCVYPTGTCSLYPLGTYMIDVDQASDLFLAVEVHNQLVDNTSVDSGLNDTHNAFVDHFSVDFSASIPGTSGDVQNVVPVGGTSVIGVELIGTDTRNALHTQLHGTNNVVEMTADLKLSGRWGDQSHFETAPRKFGIEACAGCLGTPVCGAGKTLAYCPGPGIWPSSSACL